MDVGFKVFERIVKECIESGDYDRWVEEQGALIEYYRNQGSEFDDVVKA